TINANAAYSVGDSAPTGCTPSASAACASVVGLAPGGSATCTVTNDDQPATLTVIKHVINNNGGTATAASFTMSVGGGTPSSFARSEDPRPGDKDNANAAYYVGGSESTSCRGSQLAAC